MHVVDMYVHILATLSLSSLDCASSDDRVQVWFIRVGVGFPSTWLIVSIQGQQYTSSFCIMTVSMTKGWGYYLEGCGTGRVTWLWI